MMDDVVDYQDSDNEFLRLGVFNLYQNLKNDRSIWKENDFRSALNQRTSKASTVDLFKVLDAMSGDMIPIGCPIWSFREIVVGELLSREPFCTLYDLVVERGIGP